MSDKEHAQLVLRGYDISAIETNIGVTNATNTHYLWKNINFGAL